MPVTSRILTGDSQKLSFSMLTKVPFLIFWSDNPPRCASSAHVSCRRAGTWAAWAEVARRNINHPVKSDEIFLKVGTPNESVGASHKSIFLIFIIIWTAKFNLNVLVAHFHLMVPFLSLWKTSKLKSNFTAKRWLSSRRLIALFVIPFGYSVITVIFLYHLLDKSSAITTEKAYSSF